MGLTVAEKDAFKQILSDKINKKIREVQFEHRGDISTIERNALIEAYSALNVSAQIERLAEIKKEEEALKEEKSELNSKVEQAIRNSPYLVKDSEYDYSWQNKTVDALKKSRMKAAYEATDWGKQINYLAAQLDDILMAVWIATSPVQIRELVERVDKILKNEPSDIQAASTTITPPEE